MLHLRSRKITFLEKVSTERKLYFVSRNRNRISSPEFFPNFLYFTTASGNLNGQDPEDFPISKLDSHPAN